MMATFLYLFEFQTPDGSSKLAEPVKPKGDRYGVSAEGPGKPYIVKMKLREVVL